MRKTSAEKDTNTYDDHRNNDNRRLLGLERLQIIERVDETFGAKPFSSIGLLCHLEILLLPQSRS
jgi:hypothetical protein